MYPREKFCPRRCYLSSAFPGTGTQPGGNFFSEPGRTKRPHLVSALQQPRYQPQTHVPGPSGDEHAMPLSAHSILPKLRSQTSYKSYARGQPRFRLREDFQPKGRHRDACQEMRNL